MSIKKSLKVIANPSVSAWVYNVIQIGSIVFILPLILKQFSVVEVSFWLLLATISGFALLTDLGFSNTLIRCVSLFKAGVAELPEDVVGEELKDETSPQINYDGLLRLLKTIKFVYTIINLSCLILIILFGISLCYNLFSLTDDKTNLFLAFGITCLYSTINVASSMWASYTQGLGLIYKINYVKIITGSIKLLLLIVLLLFGLKLWILTLVLLTEASVNYYIARKIVLDFFKDSFVKYDLKDYKYDSHIFKVLWKPTWKMAGMKLGGYLINQGNTIVIAQIPNPTVIASFMFTKKMLDFLITISMVPFSVNLNHIYADFVSKNALDFRKEVSVVIFIGLSIFTLGSLSIGLLGNDILKLAHINSFILDNPAFGLLALTALLEIHHLMHGGIYMATNKVPFLIPAIVSGLLILGLGFIFVSKVDVLGLILIQFFVQLALNNWYAVYLSLKLMKWPFKEYLYEMPVYGFQGLKSFVKKR